MNKKTNIQYLCDVKKIKSSELAQKLGISQSHMSLISTGRQKLTSDMKFRISQILGCSVDDIGYDDTIPALEQMLNTASISNPYLSIPLYDVKTSCGAGVINYNNYIQLNIGIEYFVNTTGIAVKEQDIHTKRFCFMWARGDSMYNPKYEASIKDGDLLPLDLSIKSIETYKQILVFKDAEGNLYVKQVFIPEMSHITIQSFNEEYKSWIDITSQIFIKTFGEIEIIGRVVWNGSRMGF